MAVFGSVLPRVPPLTGLPGSVPPPVTQTAPVTCGPTVTVHCDVPFKTKPAFAVAVTVKVPVAPAL